MSCQPLDHGGDCLRCIHTYWNRDKFPSGDNCIFSIRALYHCVSNMISHFYFSHIWTDRVDDPCGFLSKREWQWSLVSSHALIDIEEIDTNHFDLDAGFPCIRLRYRNIFKLQGFPSTELFHTDSFHMTTLFFMK